MPEMGAFETPILLIIFNRPDTTRVVFSRIREMKPKHLFIAADGPRPGNANDATKCAQVREETLKAIDWDCEVKTLFRETNLGCGKGVSSAIDWFFEQHDRGIILEDDCVPDLSFFPYCRNLLERYVDDERVMHISGNNFQDGLKAGDASYYFSRFAHAWGWATWRRAWRHFDFDLKSYPEFRRRDLMNGLWPDKAQRKWWLRMFDKALDPKKNASWWDYQWEYAVLSQNGLSILPNVNLVSNIGFGADATHTTDVKDGLAAIGTAGFNGELRHPALVAADAEADRRTYWKMYHCSLAKKISNRLKALVKHTK